MDYFWIKALHIISVVTWIGGMLVVAITLAAFSKSSSPHDGAGSALLSSVRQWDRRITTPAMIFVWCLGLALATTGGWFSDIWMMIKLGIVGLLSALHGALSGRLRRLSTTHGTSSAMRPFPFAPVILVATATIILLVVLKPI